MVHNAWLRPKTSSGLPNNDSSSLLPPPSHSSSASTSAVPAYTTTSSTSTGTSSAPSFLSDASVRPDPEPHNRRLTTRRSAHEFFHSTTDSTGAHAGSANAFARPRPSSSYLLSSFGTGAQSDAQSLPFLPAQGPHTNNPNSRNRFKAGIEEARGAFSAMARKALQGSRDMRPTDRLSTHDSFAPSQSASSSSTLVASHNSNASSTTLASIPPQQPSRSSSSVSSSSSSSRPHHLHAYHQHSSSRSIRRFKSLRDKAHPRRVFHSLVREPLADEDTRMNDAPSLFADESPASYTWSHQHPIPVPGSAARAAAAEHNSNSSSSNNNNASKANLVLPDPEASPPQHNRELSDAEDEEDEVRIAKKRKGGKAKFSAIKEDVDMLYAGYDSMEADNGVDEFTDRRRSKPPARTDLVGKLPTEIAAGILSYLDDTALTRCLRVSRRWNEVAESPAVWRSSFLGRYARADDNVLPYIQFGGQGLGRRANKPQDWQKMCAARRKVEKNWKAMQPKAVYFVGHTDSVYCCQFDEDKIITGSRDRTIRVWDLNAPYKCRKVIGGPAARPVRPAQDANLETHPTNTVHQTRSLNGTPEGDAIFHVPSDYHTASILCLQFDNEIMVTGSSDHSCIVWDIKTFEPIRRLQHHTAGVLDVCMDDQYIISCSKDAHICVWDRKTLTLIKALHGHRGPVNAVQLREIDGRKLLVSASGDGLAKIWDLQKLDVVRQFNSQDRGLAAVEFSDDGKHVLAGGNDQVIYKFDAGSTELVHTFRGHNSLVRSLFLDSANARVVSGSYDQGIRVYDFASGELVGSYDNWTTSWILAAKGDWRRIVATSQDGRALLMDYGWGVADVDLLSGGEGANTAEEIL